MCGDVMEKTAANNAIIHHMAGPSPDRQKDRAASVDLPLRHGLLVVVQLLSHHPIISLSGTFLVGPREERREERWALLFSANSAEQPGILPFSWPQGYRGWARGQGRGRSCPECSLFWAHVCILRVRVKGGAGIYFAQRSF